MSELRDMQMPLFVINLILMVFVTFFVSILPIITRKSLLFGVRVPEAAGKSPEAARLKGGYIATVLAGGVALTALLVAQYIAAPDYTLLATMYFFLPLMALQYGAFIPRWKAALALKAEKGWGTATPALADTRSAVEREKLLSFPKVWYLVCLGLILAVSVLSLVRYPLLPDPIPTHWNAQMQPDAWSDKNLLTVLMLPLVALGTMLIMAGSNIAIYRMKLQVDAENPALSYAQHRRYRRMMSHGLGVVTAAITVFILFTQLMMLDLVVLRSSALLLALTVALIVISCAPFAYITLKAGQGGNKLRIPPEEIQTQLGHPQGPIRAAHPERGDDRYWKLGLFYYNKDDPAMLIEDRFGTNGGFNYARPAVQITAGILAAVIVVTYALITVFFLRAFP